MRDQPGRVEAAEGGTLFLDEIGELPPALQAKLLRFLQDKRVRARRREPHAPRRRARRRRDQPRPRGRRARGRFREDLLYRLNVIEMRVPPLRERREDILPLARRFLRSSRRRKSRRSAPELSPAAEEALLNYDWPGNVRELRNAIERAVILWPAHASSSRRALPERIAAAPAIAPHVGGDFTLDEIEREHILRVRRRSETLEDAARILGIDTSTLWRKRKKYDEPT